MFLFEVRENVQTGFKLVMRNHQALVALGYDNSHQGPVFLPLGNSLEKLLRHPDDQDLPFRLLHARLEEKTTGMVLTAQTTDDALAEGKALVMVEGCMEQSMGVTVVADAYGRTRPELLSYTEDGAVIRRLFIFKPGDALFISWSAMALDQDYPKRFIIAWDGRDLRELAVGRPRRNFRPQLKRQEESTPERQQVALQELRS